MRGAALSLFLLALVTSPALAKPGYTHGVANSVLVAAAKATPLKLIDYDQVLCRNDRTVEQWLRELTAGEAKAIVWTGGPCELVQPGTIDAGSDWCAQASITLKHPRSPQDRPMVEIYFDTPTHGRPSPAYAFRGMIDDEGLVRFRADFEGAWLERFPANRARIICPDDSQ
jgi:hypothetical protein